MQEAPYKQVLETLEFASTLGVVEFSARTTDGETFGDDKLYPKPLATLAARPEVSAVARVRRLLRPKDHPVFLVWGANGGARALRCSIGSIVHTPGSLLTAKARDRKHELKEFMDNGFFIQGLTGDCITLEDIVTYCRGVRDTFQMMPS